MTGHTASVYSLAFSAESSLLVSGAADWTVRCWDVKAAGGLPTKVRENGAAVNGGPRTFDAIVTRVWSGDQISVVDKDGSKERRLQFSSTRGPK